MAVNGCISNVVTFLSFISTCVIAQNVIIPREARWCTTSVSELKKCRALQFAIETRWLRNTTLPPGLGWTGYDELPKFECTLESDVFACMQAIDKNTADLMALDPGMGFTAGQYFTMMPLVAEKYTPDSDKVGGLDFKAVAVVLKSNKDINIKNLAGKKSCHPGVGHAAGWVYPVSELIDKDYMPIAECNVPVKSAAEFFGQMCAPNGLARWYNPFGNNPVSVCEACAGTDADYCTGNDPYAGYFGALRCVLDGGGDVAFIREQTVFTYQSIHNDTDVNDFELLCPDGSRRAVSDAARCHWGDIPSHVVMTSAVREAQLREAYKQLLQLMVWDFGPGGEHNDLFDLFSSEGFAKRESHTHDLMFTEETLAFVDVASVEDGRRDTYYTWVGEAFTRRIETLNQCPLQQARWCVISELEMSKCEDMIMAFAAKSLKPDLNCILGDSIRDCMEKIATGDADMTALDAADVYIAGRYYGLVPMAAEDYSGYSDQTYYAVAVARKVDSYLTIFNLKSRRSCHSGVMTAAGWVIPVDKLIETGQIHVRDKKLYHAVGQLFSKSCVPGVLNKYYNPHGTNPMALCEACASGGPERCNRNDNELYYGNSGAFRCLTEKGGDIAFVKHTTVRENTNGKNPADWARNRRSDDYQLLCNDGTRKPIDEWADCHMGLVPANAIVTASFKTGEERQIYWTLLNYAQQFFASDSVNDFSMFDSSRELNHKDLIFQDSTVRLVVVPPEKQDYESYLGSRFVRSMNRLEDMDDITTAGVCTMTSSVWTLSAIVTSTIILLH